MYSISDDKYTVVFLNPLLIILKFYRLCTMVCDVVVVVVVDEND